MEALEKAGDSSFGLSIRAAVRGLWNGSLDDFAFIDSMYATIRRGYTVAFREGLKTCGVLPGDMTLEETSRLEQEINQETLFIPNFASDIARESKSNKGHLAPLLKRAEMWTNKYIAIRSLAMTFACGDRKLKWRVNITKEHCSSCLRLDGRVYRASIWRKYDLAPRMRKLECKGYRCGCEFIPTDEPVTPGRPPRI